MKLFELIGVKPIQTLAKYDDKYADSIIQSNLISYLSSLGFKSIGDGLYASVLEHPKFDYVIKLFKSDKCYIEFVKYIISNQSNPHVPKIKGKLVKLAKDTNIFGIRMEKLKAVDLLDLDHELLSYLYKNNMLSYHERTFVQDTIPEGEIDQLVDQFRENQNDFFNLLEQLLSKPTNCRWDLHPGNFMKRGSTLVLTDPWANKDSSWNSNSESLRKWIIDVK